MAEASVPPEPSGRAFWVGVLFGVPILGFGIRGLFVDAASAAPGEVLPYLLGGVLVHDALVVPLVGAVGVGARRLVGPRSWPPVRWGLVTTAIVLVVSRPFVGRYGYRASNPTAIARDYGVEVAVVLALVWGVVAVWLGWRWVRHSSPPTAASSPTSGAVRRTERGQATDQAAGSRAASRNVAKPSRSNEMS